MSHEIPTAAQLSRYSLAPTNAPHAERQRGEGEGKRGRERERDRGGGEEERGEAGGGRETWPTREALKSASESLAFLTACASWGSG